MRLSSTDLDMNELACFVNSKYGVNLSMYRSSCIKRRIIHRLNMVGCDDMDQYFAFLGENPGEIEKLMDIVTIHVTSFFRDPDIFDTLEKKVLPEIISRKARSSHPVVRVWSAGCSTGEEPYSIAILLDYLRRKTGADFSIEVFGTDLSEDAVRTARAGLYEEERISEVPALLRHDVFTPQGEMFKISSRIRKLVKFQPHNLFLPAPFSMIDLITCRNVLIHFEHDARGRINDHFYSSLAEDGMLVLGKSEAMGDEMLGRFDIVYPRCKIYKKVPGNNSKEER